MTTPTKTKEVTLQPDMATMRIRIQRDGAEDVTCVLDVTSMALLGEAVERKHIPEGDAAEAWKPSAEFIKDLADAYNAANILPVALTPTDAYHLYFDMVERWAELKKNMSFIPTSPSSTEPEVISEETTPKSEPDSGPT